MLAYLLDRALVPGRAAVLRAPDPTARIQSSIPPGFRGTRMELGSSAPWARWGASLVLRRLGDGVTIGQLAAELGVEPGLLQVALRDLAARPHVSDRLAGILGQLAEGNTITQAARNVGITKKETAAELEPSDELVGALCASLMARAALPGPSAGYLATTTQGPWRTMPVRLPVQQYERLKGWCEENSFPMAVVVRGVVERFLDEQQRRA